MVLEGTHGRYYLPQKKEECSRKEGVYFYKLTVCFEYFFSHKIFTNIIVMGLGLLNI